MFYTVYSMYSVLFQSFGQHHVSVQRSMWLISIADKLQDKIRDIFHFYVFGLQTLTRSFIAIATSALAIRLTCDHFRTIAFSNSYLCFDSFGRFRLAMVLPRVAL